MSNQVPTKQADSENQDITFGEALYTVATFSTDFRGPDANEARARNVYGHLKDFAKQNGSNIDNEPVEQGIRDLVCDLCHLADALGYDPRDLLDTAHGCYQEEKEDPEGI